MTAEERWNFASHTINLLSPNSAEASRSVCLSAGPARSLPSILVRSFVRWHLNTAGPVSAGVLALSAHSAPVYCWTDNLPLAGAPGYDCSLVASLRAKRLLKKIKIKESLLAKRPQWCPGKLLKGQPSILRIKRADQNPTSFPVVTANSGQIKRRDVHFLC